MKQLPVGHEGAEPIVARSYGESPSEQEPSLREFLGILRRRRAIALQTLVVVAALGIVLTLMTKPTYLSTARVLVEGKTQQMMINNASNPLSNLFLPSVGQQAQTQVEILRSSSIVNRAYKRANVAPGTVNLDVRRVGETDVIDLSATSTSPDAAYGLLDALPKVYLTDKRVSRMSEVAAALDFAQNRLREEKKLLRESEVKLEKFKQKAGVIDPESQRKSELNGALQAQQTLLNAQNLASSLRAQLSALRAARAGLSDVIEGSITTSNTQQIQTLQARIDDLKSERARLQFLYKDSDDEVRKVDLQIADLQRRLSGTPREVTTTQRERNPAVAEYDTKIADAQTSLRAAEANLGTLRARAESLKRGLARYNPLERELAELQRTIAGSTGQVVTLSQSVNDLTLRKKAMEASSDPIRVIEPASQAFKIAPNVQRNIILAVALGLLLGCGAAMLQESLDDHIRDEDEARRLLGTPVLGHFPLMSDAQQRLLPSFSAAARSRADALEIMGSDGSGDDMKALALSAATGTGPARNLLEKFRVLRSNVQFTLVDRPHRTMLVTSSVPQEGKSYTAANLAVTMAMDGRRVILIDADLHRPRVHESFEVALQPGLTNILVGQAQLEGCLRVTGVPGLRLLTAGVLPPNPVELLNSPSMEAMMEELKEHADILIFDSPPLLATADAQVLASKVDGVLYVMQLGRVPKSSVLRSFELLQQARANVIGIVLNKIDEKSTRSGYYGGYYGDGYTDQRNIPPSSPNGSSNGHSSSGHVPNGHVPNGHVANGHVPNGHVPADTSLKSNGSSNPLMPETTVFDSGQQALATPASEARPTSGPGN